MKKQRSNEKHRKDQADVIRRMMAVKLAEQKPTENAKKWYSRPPYQVGKMIRAQGEQMEHKDVLDYLAEKYDIKTGVDADAEQERARENGRIRRIKQ